MKNILLLVTLLLLIAACNCKTETDLDQAKKFKPDNKYFKATLVSMHFITETRDIPEVDSLYKKRIESYGLPVTAAGCADGVYTGSSPADAYDFVHAAKVTIKDEKIVAIDYEEVKPDGTSKEHDPEYNEEYSVMGTTPKEYYPKYRQALLDEQDIMKIDGISGASYTLYRFRFAVMVALMKARVAEDASKG